ncbi:MAG: hypothetical protein ACI3ZK_08540, partial [Candidatus Cryptobacteroides sp.]
IIALKTTYNGLPELKSVYEYNVIWDNEVDYGFGSAYRLLTPTSFDSIQIDRYDYVIFIGTLQQSGNYWNVIVDGATRIGSISFPYQDLTPFIDQKVVVEGWFCGISGSQYMNIVLKKIYGASGDGGTEDIIPGDDIVELPEIPE